MLPRCPARLLVRLESLYPNSNLRTLHSSPTLCAKPLPPRRVLLDSEITEAFLKGSGPGGQKINKTSSAVQLKHHPTGIVVKCQESRSRSQNRKVARKLLQDRIEEMEMGEEARTRVRARREAERKKSAGKKRRRKYRALEEAKAGSEKEEEEGEPEREEDKDEEGDGVGSMDRLGGDDRGIMRIRDASKGSPAHKGDIVVKGGKD